MLRNLAENRPFCLRNRILTCPRTCRLRDLDFRKKALNNHPLSGQIVEGLTHRTDFLPQSEQGMAGMGPAIIDAIVKDLADKYCQIPDPNPPANPDTA